ncbi:MAG: lyase family protein [Actinomycetota bacterium]|nr:lyase family protein [Actinomycetota bacterium]
MSELFAGLQAAGGVRDAVSDLAWVQAMLDAEAALAGALADAGRIGRVEADSIAAACDASLYDVTELGRAAVSVGNPVVPLVRELTRQAGDAGASVHSGATSQDILDTAAMLVARRAMDVLLADLAGCADAVARLAADHVDAVQAGRTLLQQAAPTTFGLTAAVWLSGLVAAEVALRQARGQLAVQLGGAVGTLAALGDDGPAVLTSMARRLDLAEPVLPWHTERSRIAALAAALGQTAGTVATIGRAITLLAQTEIGELTEEGPQNSGGSSTMPHKRNPVAAVLACSCAQQAPGLVATLLATMGHEHQRAAGSWHAEWRPLTELLRSTGSAVAWLRTSLQRLRVHPERMRRNVEAAGGLLTTERVTTVLTGALGRLAAHDAVAACSRRAVDGDGDLLDLLAADPVIGGQLDRAQLRHLLDPAQYLGSAEEFVHRTLHDYDNRRGRQ